MSVHIQESRVCPYPESVHIQIRAQVRIHNSSPFPSLSPALLVPRRDVKPRHARKKEHRLDARETPSPALPPTMQNPPQRPLRTRASTRSRAANCPRPSPTTPPTYPASRNQRPPQLTTPLPPSAPATSADTTPRPATRLEDKPKAGTGDGSAHGHA
ncbi:hypothetical protein HETIRDRAFT_105815 [Heterobasidion irregulare TC 32-1]|uniref:Uncharacterized protein n=1 Tax=Heterobasidion irregulare (strain TC 32-1) TaxID=747525 RepID=W4JRY7_HETIT|nr:uncharacterized protein HETIRDRAFT_105815 [Heterobasidion irregulare TC 32-1]ETW76312.1 hypothetical protein HETIRDRAFT_105815 [Heterobasidion irregulare TC 32-1]